MAKQIALLIVNALEIYQYILILYAFSTLFRPRSELYYRVVMFLKSASDLIVKPIEEMVPSLRFFSVIISYFIIEFVKIYVYNSFFL